MRLTLPDRGRKQLAARFGGIPLRRQRAAVMTDMSPIMASVNRNELIHGCWQDGCELCESTVRLEIRHLRKLADLRRAAWRNGPAATWHRAPGRLN